MREESVLVRDVYIVLRKKERELFQGTHRYYLKRQENYVDTFHMDMVV